MKVPRQEQRSCVKIAALRGRNAKECQSELTEALGNSILPYRTVARWAAAFQRGRVAIADMQRTRRPRTVRTDVARAVIAQCLEDDRRWSLRELQAYTGIDQETVHKILREDLHMRKAPVTVRAASGASRRVAAGMKDKPVIFKCNWPCCERRVILERKLIQGQRRTPLATQSCLKL